MAVFSHFRFFAANLAGKSTLFALKLIGRSATTLPGRVSEIIYPGTMNRLLSPLNKTIIVVGTNGKTTTSAMLSEMLRSQGYMVIANSAGSNFNRGVISSLLSYKGDKSRTVGVFELDEAHSKHFVAQHRPDHVLVLNLMRDQLDRYGELDYTRQLMANAASHAKTSVIVNGNNLDLHQACINPKTKTITFGAAEKLSSRLSHHDNPDPENDQFDVVLEEYSKDSLSLSVNQNEQQLESKIDGLHNAVNFTAALAAAVAIDSDGLGNYLTAAKNPPSVFGRGETVQLNNKRLKIILVKNPEGFQRALETEAAQSYAIAVNDNYADGRDPSWLWDVQTFDKHLADKTVICAGTRANDMALRLAYALDSESINIDTTASLSELIANIESSESSNITAFCTYTAMLELRHVLAAKGYLKSGGVHV